MVAAACADLAQALKREIVVAECCEELERECDRIERTGGRQGHFRIHRVRAIALLPPPMGG